MKNPQRIVYIYWNIIVRYTPLPIPFFSFSRILLDIYLVVCLLNKRERTHPQTLDWLKDSMYISECYKRRAKVTRDSPSTVRSTSVIEKVERKIPEEHSNW